VPTGASPCEPILACMCCTIASAGCGSLAPPTFLIPTCHPSCQTPQVSTKHGPKTRRAQSAQINLQSSTVTVRKIEYRVANAPSSSPNFKNTPSNNHHCPKATSTCRLQQSVIAITVMQTFRLRRAPRSKNVKNPKTTYSSKTHKRPHPLRLAAECRSHLPKKPTPEPVTSAQTTCAFCCCPNPSTGVLGNCRSERA